MKAENWIVDRPDGKTRIAPKGAHCLCRLLFCLMLLASTIARAQVVADGQTFVLDGGSNYFQNGIIIGTNAANTLFVLTNGAILTNVIFRNDSNVVMGASATATNTRVIVTGAGSYWEDSGNFFIGSGGAQCELDILDGAWVGCVSGSTVALGQTVTSSNNLAVISGTNSKLANYIGSFSLIVGSNSSGNAMIVTNGGRVSCSYCELGYTGIDNNRMVVTGPGSSLHNSYFTIGNSGVGNQCIISNGALLAMQTVLISGTSTVFTVTGVGSICTNDHLMLIQSSNSLFITAGGKMVDLVDYIGSDLGSPNTIVVAGNGSQWMNTQTLLMGGIQLLITNGGTVIDNLCHVGDNHSFNNSGSNTFVLISDEGSLWTNSTLYLGYYNLNNQIVISNNATVYVNAFYLGYGKTDTNNFLTVDGGTFTERSGTAYGGTIILKAGLINCGNLNFNNSVGQIIFNGGTMRVDTLNYSNSSPFVVGDGVRSANLCLNPGSSLTASNGLIISSNALLNGNGTVSANVTVQSGGTFTPLASPFAINGKLNLNTGSTTIFNINSTNPSALVTGLTNLVYGGTLQLTNTGADYADGQTFKLFTSTRYSGSFDNINPPTPGPQLRWDTDRLTYDGTLRVFNTNTVTPSFRLINTTMTNQITQILSGVPYDLSYLLATTNIGDPMTNWTCILTNRFDGNGAVFITNPVDPNFRARFFRMKFK